MKLTKTVKACSILEEKITAFSCKHIAKRNILLVLLGLNAAFDTIDYETLLSRIISDGWVQENLLSIGSGLTSPTDYNPSLATSLLEEYTQ
ncbi:reverse transcriptase-like protein [Elysia marginata]|uniref:Reverse transcriptase-like protein n=1 Tax=Elysia marginata TaxID=1093978 RepID=A0AAV4ELF3_9GAST|nr:reverse transcriptase-like protein [Elysia marginata]